MVDDHAQSRAHHAGRRTTAATLVGLLGVLALVAAGCGGSSDKKANEAYADSVCTAVGTWEQQVKSIVSTFSGIPSKAGLQTKITQVESATKTLVTEIKAVPPPDTSDGRAAKHQLDQLSTDVTTTIDSARTAVVQLPADASAAQIALALAPLVPQLQGVVASGQSAVTALKDAGGGLGSAFKSTDSCQSLGSS
jgi:hypothetical protein